MNKFQISLADFPFPRGFILDAKVNPKTYIVRVYRFSRENPRRLVGVVEEIGRKGKKAFTGYQELWEILGSSKSIKHQKKRIKYLTTEGTEEN